MNYLKDKLHASGFEKNSLKIIWNYLTDHEQRTKINTGFGSWTKIIK